MKGCIVSIGVSYAFLWHIFEEYMTVLFEYKSRGENIINVTSYCGEILSFARQRFGKHRLEAGIATETEVHLLGNGSLVSATTDNTE
jgi:hypothetical protein